MEKLHKYFENLELNKILKELAGLTCCEGAAWYAENIKPETNCELVREEIAKTDSAFSLSTRFGSPEFISFKSCDQALKRAKAGSVMNTSELLNIARVLRQAKKLSLWKSRCKDEQSPLFSMFDQLSLLPELEKRISGAIISEDEIDDNASEELYRIRRKINSLRLKIRERLEELVRSDSMQKYLQEPIVTMRFGRFVVPVKAEFKGNVKGMVHDTSSTGSTLFIEPESVVEANNEIRMLEAAEQEEIERIITQLSSEAAQFEEEINADYQLCVLINVYFAKARLAERMNAFAPEISDNGRINLIKARHPLIDSSKVVPVNIAVGGDYDTLVITGPNTGGKTVSLKILGLFTLMAMCGLLIPAAPGSMVSVFDNVLVDIGDEQSIEQSLSTFSSHMSNIVYILDKANERSLVLLDELGSGTDPVEGAALAVSVLEKLKEKGAKVAATTHYAELKMYALETPRVENASCEFDVESLKPTYRLIIGTPGRSNAFEISRKLGLEEDILENAKKIVSQENKRFEDVVEKLEKARLEFERKTMEVETQKAALEEKNRELEKKLASIESIKKEQAEKAKQQAKKIIDDVRLRSQALIDELDRIRREKDKAEFSSMAAQAKSRVKGELERLYDYSDPAVEKKNTGYKLPRPLKAGDTVLIYDIDKKATVISPPDKSGNVYLQAGIMKTRVPVSNLRLIEEEKVKVSGRTIKSFKSKAERTVKTEVDLRGMNAEEALMTLDAFIDNAVLSGVGIISIIHGKGTGVLRRAVSEHLKRHGNIKSFRLGVFGEGEDGVTIAELK